MLVSLSFSPQLPPEVAEAFHNLALAQQGKPEQAAMKVQQWCPGVLGTLVEHLGDIIYNLCRDAIYGDCGYETVNDKVRKSLKVLTNTYGFERALRDNSETNARYRNVNVMLYEGKTATLLRLYSAAYSALTVYNEVQWLARQASMNVGFQKYQEAITCLTRIAKMCATEDTFRQHAFQYEADEYGNPLPYKIL